MGRKKPPMPETRASQALDTAKIIIGRLPENCVYAFSLTDDCAELEVYPDDKKQYLYVSMDYRFAPKEMQRIEMRRGILTVIINPPEEGE